MYNIDLWLLTYEKELSDELGAPPAFDKVVTDKPAGAQVQAGAEQFAAGDPVEEPAGEEIPEIGAGEVDDITTDLESILMME